MAGIWLGRDPDKERFLRVFPAQTGETLLLGTAGALALQRLMQFLRFFRLFLAFWKKVFWLYIIF
jgi:hypothetical protein